MRIAKKVKLHFMLINCYSVKFQLQNAQLFWICEKKGKKILNKSDFKVTENSNSQIDI